MALLLTTCTVNAAEEWTSNFRRCDVTRFVAKEEMDNYADGSGSLVFITPDDISALERGLAVLKQCKKFWECVNRRDAGLVKHCYLPKRVVR